MHLYTFYTHIIDGARGIVLLKQRDHSKGQVVQS